MKSIEVKFQLNRKNFALQVNLSLPSRGITAFFGPSGCGKTTLLRCIAGLEYVPGGYLSIAGEIWQDAKHFLPPHKRRLGYVFQEASLFPHLNVQHNLEYGMRRTGVSQNKIDDAISLLGITHLLGRRPENLSGGERQRVAIARALLVNPGILLMDEPLAALDTARKQEILPYLEQLHEALSIPILYVSHSPDEVARLADHLVVLDRGNVIAEGALSETLARLDLPVLHGEEHSVVIDAIIGARDEVWHLIRADFAGGKLWVRDNGIRVGHRVRVRILARDVSLSLTHTKHASIINLLPGKIEAVIDDLHPAQSLAKVDVGGTPIVSRLTKRSAAILGLSPGQSIWVQIKTVALIG